jgi:hypothetical protein
LGYARPRERWRLENGAVGGQGHSMKSGTIADPVAGTCGFDEVGEVITKAAQSGGMVLFTPRT